MNKKEKGGIPIIHIIAVTARDPAIRMRLIRDDLRVRVQTLRLW